MARKENLVFAFVAVGIIFYSLAFLAINSFEINGKIYYTIFDDETISLRCGENIAKSGKPYWNEGEAVEGFSNPLWTYLMALPHLAKIPKSKTALFTIFLSIGSFIATLRFAQKASEEIFPGDFKVSAAVAILVGFYLPSLNWALQGSETVLFSLVAAASFFWALKSFRNGEFKARYLIPACALFLLRMDGSLIAAALTLAYIALFHDKTKKILSRAGLFFLIAAIFLFAWRLFYFREFLPNTYYLKMTGYPVLSRICKGAYSSVKFISFSNPFVIALPFVAYFLRKSEVLIFPLLLFVIFLLYNVWIGGDAWDWWLPANRFLSAVVPVFIVAVVFALKRFLEKAKLSEKSKRIAFWAAVIVVFASLNFNRIEYLRGELLLSPTFTKKDNYNSVRLALEAKPLIPPREKAAVALAGVLPYFLERQCVDLLGKNDKRVARLEIPKERSSSCLSYEPGHLKWNYAYSIGELKPFAVLQLWKDKKEARPFLDKSYYSLVLPCGKEIYLKK